MLMGFYVFFYFGKGFKFVVGVKTKSGSEPSFTSKDNAVNRKVYFTIMSLTFDIEIFIYYVKSAPVVFCIGFLACS
jgi:hypothetical protein